MTTSTSTRAKGAIQVWDVLGELRKSRSDTDVKRSVLFAMKLVIRWASGTNRHVPIETLM